MADTLKAKQITLLMADTLKWVIFNTILIKKTVCALFVFFTSQIAGWYFNQRATSYELRVNILMSCIYCTSYELLFVYELRVAVYCPSYELFFTYELRVTVYCTIYELFFVYELRVTVHCTSYELIYEL